MSMNQDPAQYLRQAIRLARENVESGTGGPFGAVIVRNGEVIATGTNQVTASRDPTSHAEIVSIYWARPDRVVFASTAHDAADAGFDDSFIYDEIRRSRDRRRMPLEQLVVPEAGEEFEAWMESEDRVEY